MGQGLGCCTTRDDTITPRPSTSRPSARPSARTPAASHRKVGSEDNAEDKEATESLDHKHKVHVVGYQPEDEPDHVWLEVDSARDASNQVEPEKVPSASDDKADEGSGSAAAPSVPVQLQEGSAESSATDEHHHIHGHHGPGHGHGHGSGHHQESHGHGHGHSHHDPHFESKNERIHDDRPQDQAQEADAPAAHEIAAQSDCTASSSNPGENVEAALPEDDKVGEGVAAEPVRSDSGPIQDATKLKTSASLRDSQLAPVAASKTPIQALPQNLAPLSKQTGAQAKGQQEGDEEIYRDYSGELNNATKIPKSSDASEDDQPEIDKSKRCSPDEDIAVEEPKVAPEISQAAEPAEKPVNGNAGSAQIDDGQAIETAAPQADPKQNGNAQQDEDSAFETKPSEPPKPEDAGGPQRDKGSKETAPDEPEVALEASQAAADSAEKAAFNGHANDSQSAKAQPENSAATAQPSEQNSKAEPSDDAAQAPPRDQNSNDTKTSGGAEVQADPSASPEGRELKEVCEDEDTSSEKQKATQEALQPAAKSAEKLAVNGTADNQSDKALSGENASATTEMQPSQLPTEKDLHESQKDGERQESAVEALQEDALYNTRIRRGSFSEGSGVEVTVHRLSMLTLQKDLPRGQIGNLQAALRACVEYVPGLARWSIQPVLPDTEGLAQGYTHAMYLAFEDKESVAAFDKNSKCQEIQALISPLLQSGDSAPTLSWENRVHLRESVANRLSMLRVRDEAEVTKVLAEEAALAKDIPGFKAHHHGAHAGGSPSSKDFNYASFVSFSDVAALQEYKRHPKHKEVFSKLVKCLDGPAGSDTIICVNCELV